MIDTIKKQIRLVREKFDQLQSTTLQNREKLLENITIVYNNLACYSDSWAGDWTEDISLYRNDFDKRSQDPMKIDRKYIKEHIKQKTQIDIDILSNEISEITLLYFTFRDFILAELSFIKDINTFPSESQLIKSIEEFKWGYAKGEYIQSKSPKYAYVYDLSILNKGLQTPPHILVEDSVQTSLSKLAAFVNFDKLTNRLIRHLEIKISSNSEGEGNNPFQREALKAIIEKFHLVATQLKNRYDNRPPFVIADEYDLQDLMHSLLKINFEDVRKEEYTPSYAGGSSRVDFLLKREKIVVEVKKTRQTLKDKDVGNQLMLDIGRYKSHTDCKHLICFVYDPDNLIVNPRGLEDDLNSNSTVEMIIEVFIRPL